MKSMPAILVLTTFATGVFAFDRITAAESAAPAAAACGGSCDSACNDARSCCKQAATAAENDCGTTALSAITVSAAASTTPAVASDDCKCCCEKTCCKQRQETTAKVTPPAATNGVPTAKAVIATTVAAPSAENGDCCSGKGHCATACAGARQQTGLDPYRIAPPDVLTIIVPTPLPKFDKERRRVIRQVVDPDGSITLQGFGDVQISGMTPEEAECEIIKRILKAYPDASQAIFSVSVDVAAKNSKRAYVVLQHGAGCDSVCDVPATGESTVNCALSGCAWPQPLDFATAKIWISRPGHQGATEIVLPVAWDAEKGQPTCATNHALLPGDRVFVQLPTQQPQPVLPKLVAAEIARPASPPVSSYAPTPTAIPQPARPTTPYAPSATLYAAFPAPIPSPFAAPPSPGSLSPSVIATQAYLSTTPLVAPAATSSQEPQPAPHSCAAEACAAPPVLHASPNNNLTQVLFNVEVIEDHTGSLTEFDSLQGGMPILAADSEIMLATLRVLEKQQLIRCVSSPRVVSVVGRPAVLQIGSETPAEGEGAPSFHGRRMEVLAHELGGGLAIEFQFKDTTGCKALEIETSLMLSHGQTIIMKTAGRPAQQSDGATQEPAAEHPVYVVLTPQLVR